MTYENIPGETSQSLENLSSYPLGSKIRCVVVARGVGDAGEDSNIQIETQPVTLEESTAPVPPKFITNSLSVNLSFDGTGQAEIETTGDLEGTTVVWETVDSTAGGEGGGGGEGGEGGGEGAARFFTTMKPVCHWVDPGWEDYAVGEVVTIRLAAEHAHDIERVEFITNGNSTTVIERDEDGYFAHTYTQVAGEVITTAIVTPKIAGVPMIMEGYTSIDSEVGKHEYYIFGGPRAYVTYGGRSVLNFNVTNNGELHDVLEGLVGQTSPVVIDITQAGDYYLANNTDHGTIPTNGWLKIIGTVDGVVFRNRYEYTTDIGTQSNGLPTMDTSRNRATYNLQSLWMENVEFLSEGRSKVDALINSTNFVAFKDSGVVEDAPEPFNNTTGAKLCLKDCTFKTLLDYRPVEPLSSQPDETLNGTPIVKYSIPRDLDANRNGGISIDPNPRRSEVVLVTEDLWTDDRFPWPGLENPDFDPLNPDGERVGGVGGLQNVDFELAPRTEERSTDLTDPNFMLPDTPCLNQWLALGAQKGGAKWVLNCHAENLGIGSPFRSSQEHYALVRDCSVGNAADDILTNAAGIINFDVGNFNGYKSPMHSDGWQAYTNLPESGDDARAYGNILIKSFNCWMAWEDDGNAKIGAGQGIYGDGSISLGMDGFVIKDSEIAFSVGSLKFEFNENTFVKNVAVIDSNILKSGERWNSNDPRTTSQKDPNNPNYIPFAPANVQWGDVLFKNCKNGRSESASIYVPGGALDRSASFDVVDDQPFINWIYDGAVLPYWSPYHCHILREGDDFAEVQGNGIPEGDLEILVDDWDPNFETDGVTPKEEVLDGITFFHPHVVDSFSFLGVQGADRIGYIDTILGKMLAFHFNSSSLANQFANSVNDQSYKGYVIRDQASGTEWVFQQVRDETGEPQNVTARGDVGGGVVISYNIVRAAPQDGQDEGDDISHILNNFNGPFTVSKLPVL